MQLSNFAQYHLLCLEKERLEGKISRLLEMSEALAVVSDAKPAQDVVAEYDSLSGLDSLQEKLGSVLVSLAGIDASSLSDMSDKEKNIDLSKVAYISGLEVSYIGDCEVFVQENIQKLHKILSKLVKELLIIDLDKTNLGSILTKEDYLDFKKAFSDCAFLMTGEKSVKMQDVNALIASCIKQNKGKSGVTYKCVTPKQIRKYVINAVVSNILKREDTDISK